MESWNVYDNTPVRNERENVRISMSFSIQVCLMNIFGIILIIIFICNAGKYTLMRFSRKIFIKYELLIDTVGIVQRIYFIPIKRKKVYLNEYVTSYRALLSHI